MTLYSDYRVKRKLFRSGTSIAITLPSVFLKILEVKAGEKEIKYFKAMVDDENMQIILIPILE